MPQKINLILCPSPELFSAYESDTNDTLVIIVDILRATSVITTALGNGAESVVPVSSCQKCEELGKKFGYLKAAERNVEKCDFADLGNSPKEYTKDLVKDKGIVLTTTNGTRALTMAVDAGFYNIMTGSFLNISAIAHYIKDEKWKNVLIIASGWNGTVCIEDCLFSGCLVSVLQEIGVECKTSDMATMMSVIYKEVSRKDASLMSFLRDAEHYKRLEKHSLVSDVEYCLQRDLYDFVVLLDDKGCLKRHNMVY